MKLMVFRNQDNLCKAQMKKFPAIAILLLVNLSQAIPQTYDFYHNNNTFGEIIIMIGFIASYMIVKDLCGSQKGRDCTGMMATGLNPTIIMNLTPLHYPTTR